MAVLTLIGGGTGFCIGTGIAWYRMQNRWPTSKDGFESLAIIVISTVLGSGIGFGLGSTLLVQGKHPYNKLYECLKRSRRT